MSRPRTALLVDEYSEVVDLSGRGLSDTTSLVRCVRLSALKLEGNQHLQSVEGLQQCSRLWTLDLRGCALTSCTPLIQLGALSELHLGNNKLSLPSVLKLHSMAIGRLGLQGNPLLLDTTRASLNVKPGVDDSRVLRSFLADELPCVVAIDDSFVTSAQLPEAARVRRVRAHRARAKTYLPLALSLSLCVCRRRAARMSALL